MMDISFRARFAPNTIVSEPGARVKRADALSGTHFFLDMKTAKN